MKKILVILVLLVFTKCASEININLIALKLKKLEASEFISQIEEKKEVLDIIAPTLWNLFSKSKLDFRKSDFQDTWSIYEDNKFLIVTGTVGRSESDIQFFVIVMNQGQIVFAEIGNEKVGEYPSNIIPFSKAEMLN